MSLPLISIQLVLAINSSKRWIHNVIMDRRANLKAQTPLSPGRKDACQLGQICCRRCCLARQKYPYLQSAFCDGHRTAGMLNTNTIMEIGAKQQES